MPHWLELAPGHVPAVARLHRASLPGDFLPSLGQGFLEVMYRGMLDLGLAWGAVALEADEVVGFVIATGDSPGLFRNLVKGRFLALSWQVGTAILRRPRLLKPTLETFLYPSKEGADAAPAELLVIAVDGARRGAGIGEGLVAMVDEGMHRRGISRYKVTVLERNAGANRFYGRLGFRHQSSFDLYGKRWNLHEKREA